MSIPALLQHMANNFSQRLFRHPPDRKSLIIMLRLEKSICINYCIPLNPLLSSLKTTKEAQRLFHIEHCTSFIRRADVICLLKIYHLPAISAQQLRNLNFLIIFAYAHNQIRMINLTRSTIINYRFICIKPSRNVYNNRDFFS